MRNTLRRTVRNAPASMGTTLSMAVVFFECTYQQKQAHRRQCRRRKAISVSSVAFLISGVCKIKISAIPPSRCSSTNHRCHRRMCKQHIFYLSVDCFLYLHRRAYCCTFVSFCLALDVWARALEFLHLESIRGDARFAMNVTSMPVFVFQPKIDRRFSHCIFALQKMMGEKCSSPNPSNLWNKINFRAFRIGI